jgi:hypothetical protein
MERYYSMVRDIGRTASAIVPCFLTAAGVCFTLCGVKGSPGEMTRATPAVAACRILFLLFMCSAACAGGQTIDTLRKDHPWIPQTSVIVERDGVRLLQDTLPAGFVPDAGVLGEWRVVDLVTDDYRFLPDRQIWQETSFAVIGMVFTDDGNVAISLQEGALTDRWTAGHVVHDGGTRTDSSYRIVDLSDEKYLFYQWKSDDYSYRFRKPPYFVLKKL